MAPRKKPNQICVQFPPQTRAELAALKGSGRVLSEQEFIRLAVEEKLERLRRQERGDKDPVDLAALGDPIKAVRRKR